jgi:hypothetical protein
VVVTVVKPLLWASWTHGAPVVVDLMAVWSFLWKTEECPHACLPAMHLYRVLEQGGLVHCDSLGRCNTYLESQLQAQRLALDGIARAIHRLPQESACSMTFQPSSIHTPRCHTSVGDGYVHFIHAAASCDI